MTSDEIRQLVIAQAGACGVDPNIAVAQLARESIGFRPDVVFGPTTGGSGERGLAQFMPGTWARFGSGDFSNAFDPYQAMSAYCAYMGYLLGLFSGDYAQALTGYNGGEGHITNPGKYGPPSAAALEYSRSIIAQAGASSLPSPDGGGLPGLGPTSTTVLLLALLGLGAVFFFRD